MGNCVNLHACDRFNETMYVKSLSICGDDDAGFKLCFHHVSKELNGTKIFFFYSNLQCTTRGGIPEPTRRYSASFQLLTEGTK